MKIFLGTCKHRSVCFVKIKVVKFALDLGVMKTKVASLSKKLTVSFGFDRMAGFVSVQ